VRDFRSSNGTFVNGQRIEGETWVHPGDAIQIGPYVSWSMNMNSPRLTRLRRVFWLRLLTQEWVSKKLNILQDISLVFNRASLSWWLAKWRW